MSSEETEKVSAVSKKHVVAMRKRAIEDPNSEQPAPTCWDLQLQGGTSLTVKFKGVKTLPGNLKAASQQLPPSTAEVSAVLPALLPGSAARLHLLEDPVVLAAASRDPPTAAYTNNL